MATNHNCLLAILIEEEEVDEDLLLLNFGHQNKSEDGMLSNICSEGAYKLTIERRLLKNELIINKTGAFLLATERLRRNQIEFDLDGHVDAQIFL